MAAETHKKHVIVGLVIVALLASVIAALIYEFIKNSKSSTTSTSTSTSTNTSNVVAKTTTAQAAASSGPQIDGLTANILSYSPYGATGYDSYNPTGN